MADRNYVRRLRALTGSTTFGPKYAKLSKSDRSLVDDLVRHNAGREARRQVNALDETRRAGVRARSRLRRKVNKFDSLPQDERTRQAGIDINDENEKAFWQMYSNRHADKYGRVA